MKEEEFFLLFFTIHSPQEEFSWKEFILFYYFFLVGRYYVSRRPHLVKHKIASERHSKWKKSVCFEPPAALIATVYGVFTSLLMAIASPQRPFEVKS